MNLTMNSENDDTMINRLRMELIDDNKIPTAAAAVRNAIESKLQTLGVCPQCGAEYKKGRCMKNCSE